MTLRTTVNKYKQPILMSISLILTALFFFPWIINNPELETFAYSEIKMSGFRLFTGYHELMPTLYNLMASLEMNVMNKMLYLGYLLIVFPVLGVCSTLLSGIRHKKAYLMHQIHFISTFSLLFFSFVMVMIFGELRTLFFSIFGFGLGFYLSLIVSGIGVGMIIMLRTKK